MAEMDLPDIDLEGRVVIMTGADRGLGRAMSLGLAKKGARLVLASPVVDGLNAVAEEIAAIAGPGRALAVETDITDLWKEDRKDRVTHEKVVKVCFCRRTSFVGVGLRSSTDSPLVVPEPYAVSIDQPVSHSSVLVGTLLNSTLVS